MSSKISSTIMISLFNGMSIGTYSCHLDTHQGYNIINTF